MMPTLVIVILGFGIDRAQFASLLSRADEDAGVRLHRRELVSARPAGVHAGADRSRRRPLREHRTERPVVAAEGAARDRRSRAAAQRRRALLRRGHDRLGQPAHSADLETKSGSSTTSRRSALSAPSPTAARAGASRTTAAADHERRHARRFAFSIPKRCARRTCHRQGRRQADREPERARGVKGEVFANVWLTDRIADRCAGIRPREWLARSVRDRRSERAAPTRC